MSQKNFSHARRYTEILLLSWLSLSLVACTTTSIQRSQLPQRTFSSIALISPKDIIEINTPDTKADRAAGGAITGSAGAGLGGILIGSAACGPYLYGLCVIGLGTMGLLAGGASGALYGFSGISSDDAEKLEQRMVILSQQRDVHSELVSMVISLAPEAMLAAPESAEVQAILTIEKVEFAREQDQLSLNTHLRLTFAATESRRKPEFGSRMFYCLSSPNELGSWLDTKSDTLDIAVNQCLAKFANEIQIVLRDHWTPV
jgi:hypothetical protein